MAWGIIACSILCSKGEVSAGQVVKGAVAHSAGPHWYGLCSMWSCGSEKPQREVTHRRKLPERALGQRGKLGPELLTG